MIFMHIEESSLTFLTYTYTGSGGYLLVLTYTAKVCLDVGARLTFLEGNTMV